MAGNKTIRRNNDKATTQAFYTKATHDHGADIAYTFASREDPKTIVRKTLEKVGIYFAENHLSLPFYNKWIIVGYNVGKRRSKVQKVDTLDDDIDKNILDKQRLEIIRAFINNHEKKFTDDEEDLIDVGSYFKDDRRLDLPASFNHPLILLGYYDIPLDIIYDSEAVNHTRK